MYPLNLSILLLFMLMSFPMLICSDQDKSLLPDVCSTCQTNVTCVLHLGVYTCSCPDGIKDVKDLHPNLSCGKSKIEMCFRTCDLKTLNLDINRIHLNDKICIGSVGGTNSVVSLAHPLGAGICGTTIFINATHAIYSNTIYLSTDPSQIITREEVRIYYSCAYPLDMKTSLDAALKPILSTINITIEGAGNFKATMALYENANYTKPYQDKEIVLSTKSILYVGVFVDGGDPSQFAVVMKNCYATPTNNPEDSVKYYFIKERCPNVQDPTVNVTANGISSEGQFSVQFFKFIGDYTHVFLHCDITLCDKISSKCYPICSARSRSGYPESKKNILTIGPILRSDINPPGDADIDPPGDAGTVTRLDLLTVTGLLLTSYLFS
ncbi:hypothetical protein FKM82_022049 [Ascaphus truei]